METIIWISIVVSLFLIGIKEVFLIISNDKNKIANREINKTNDTFSKTIKLAITNVAGFIINSSIFISTSMLSGIIQTVVDSNSIVENEFRNVEVNNNLVTILISIIILGTLILNIYFCSGFINNMITIIKTKTYRNNKHR